MQRLVWVLGISLLCMKAYIGAAASIPSTLDVTEPGIYAKKEIESIHFTREQAEHGPEKEARPSYSVLIENKCVAGNEPINMHFMVVDEEKRKAHDEGINFTASITDHFSTAMAADTSKEFEFCLARSKAGLESSWRLWWDTDNIGYSRNQTLVEVHCAVGQTQSATGEQLCYMDVSNVDGLTSAVEVKFSNNSFPPITLKPPTDWQCPEANRIDQPGANGVPENFLPEWQACLSNCSLLHTDVACCPWPYDRHNCTNANPALVLAGPEAYTYAYDDESVRCNDKFCEKPLRSHSFPQNSQIMQITTCFSS